MFANGDPTRMRILGIDPGLRLTGYGCVEVHPGAVDPTLVEAGVFRLKAGASVAYRLKQLHDDLLLVVEELGAEVMAVEKLFSHYRHVRTGIVMAHARGVVMLVGEASGLDLHELAVTEIKKAVTGNGHASKLQIQNAVMRQCGLREPPQPPDVADAIAIALCAARRLAVTA